MSQTIDVTGLPQQVVQSLQSVVDGIRHSLPASNGDQISAKEKSAEEWVTEFMAWAASHPVRNIALDDSRQTIYAGRGE